MKDHRLQGCPFCGSENIDASEVLMSGDDGDKIAAGCADCGAQGPTVPFEKSMPDYLPSDTCLKASADAWNNRFI